MKFTVMGFHLLPKSADNFIPDMYSYFVSEVLRLN